MTRFGNWDSLVEHIRETTQSDFSLQRAVSVGGGSINSAYRLEGTETSYFVKTNRGALAGMFEAEALGLREILETSTVRVPSPVAHGVAGGTAYLILEWLPLGTRSAVAQQKLGSQLAAMHKVAKPFFGWHRDNTIGSTPQLNDTADLWIDFWRERRLRFQLDLAARAGARKAVAAAGEKLCCELHKFFPGYQPRPSLLHGDLWGGNAGVDAEGRPVIFDPACYYGDREADIAMTELFGGFGADFYAAYDEAFPLDDGYAVRKTVYNLYHVLNHFNLFGGGYLSQAQSMIGRLLAEVS